MADIQPFCICSSFFTGVYPYLKQHLSFYSKGLVIWHGLSDINHFKINYGQFVHCEFDKVEIFQGISLPETAHFVS